MSTYRDLSIHQRITAKANALHFTWSYRNPHLYPSLNGGPIDLLNRVRKAEPNRYCPNFPFYVVNFKTNHYDPTPWETKY